jgi:hypothetical protein
MTTTVKVLRSTDSGAPVINGVAGSLIALLDAALVNGYGSSSPLGWSKSFSGANKAAYRNSPVDGTGMYLRVQDDASDNIEARESQTSGYESMSGIDTGTNIIGTSDVGMVKSGTIDSTNRPWVIIGNNKFFHLFIQTGINDGLAASEWSHCYFGDIVSYKENDNFNFIVSARFSASKLWHNNPGFGRSQVAYNTINNNDASIKIARDQLASVGAVNCGQHTDYAKTNTTQIGSSSMTAAMPYPAPVNNGIFIARVWLHHGTGPYVVRGHIPGMWAPMHAKPLGNNDTFSGTGEMAGKTFEAFNIYNSGQVIIETSDTWY